MRQAVFAVLLITLTGCLDVSKDPTRNFNANSSLKEKLENSRFDWNDTKEVTIELKTPSDGMVNLRAINGEILYQGFLANGILSQFILNIPTEIDQVLLEYENSQELLSVRAKKIRFEF